MNASDERPVVDLEEVAAGIERAFEPVDVVTVNDSIIRIAMVHGAFVWHQHEEEELFLCWAGKLRIELEGAEPIVLERGQLFVVPKGVQHRPVADEPALTMLIETPQTKQYGD